MQTKSGIDFFPLDTYIDKKLELIEAEFGIKGFGIVVRLYQQIYGQEGYYLEWTKEVALLFSHKIGEGESVVSEIVRASIQRGIFDQRVFDEYGILTSHGIQKRYFEIVKRRKNLEINGDILLVNADSLPVDVCIKRKNASISEKNVNISEQSKVKESKVKESKVKESKVKESKESVEEERAREDVDETSAAADPEFGRVMSFFLDKINPTPSTQCTAALKEYTKRLTADVVLHAFEIALDEQERGWYYIHGILRRYSEDGLTDMDSVLRSEQEFRENKTKSERRGRNKNSLAQRTSPESDMRKDVTNLKKLYESIRRGE